MGTISNRCVILDGFDEHIIIGNVAELNFDTSDTFSVSAWISLDYDFSARSIISKMQGASTWTGWSFQITSAKLEMQLISDWGATDVLYVQTTDLVISHGTWLHVAVTMDGTGTAAGTTFYINGIEITAKTSVYDSLTGSSAGTGLAAIGRLDGGASQHFVGAIDDVAVYNKELSAAEITTIFNSGDPPDLTSTGPTGNLVGYWKIGDGDTYPTATDSSASGNDGTYTNTEATDIVHFGAGPQDIYLGISTGSSGSGVTTYYKMTGRDSSCPTPTYHSWVVTGSPDFAAASAGTLPCAGPLVDIYIADQWSV